MTSIVLFLDDSEERINKAIEMYKDFDLYVARTASEAIAWLSGIDEWLVVSLDHDLGDEVFVNSNREDCGMEVIRYIESLERKPTISNIIIHSWNLPAAERMEKALRRFYGYDVVRIPFDGTYL